MRHWIHKIRDHVGGINGVLLMIYSFLIFFANTVTSEKFFLQYAFFAILVIGILCFLLCPILLRYVSKVSLCGTVTDPAATGRRNTLLEISFFVIPLLYFLFYYISYYPGNFSGDSVDQYFQAVTNEYRDWHPVLHTLLTFKLPLLLTGGWTGAVVLFQVLVFSAVLGYAFHVVRKYTNVTYAVLTMTFVLLNPQLGGYAMFPWKDVAFMICAILLVTCSLQIFFTKGEWLRHPLHIAAFAIVATCATVIRHNGVLFTIPLVFAVLLCIPKKRGLILCVSVLVLFAGVKYPLYSLLDVEEPDKRQIETLGLPMTVIGTVVTHAPETLDEETREFAYRVAPEEVWEEVFRDGSYNTVKWDERTSNEVIEQYGTAKVLSMMLGCFKNAPLTSLYGLVKLTEGVYSVSNHQSHIIVPYHTGDGDGITQSGIGSLRELTTGYLFSVSELFPRLFLYIGVMHFILIVAVLSKCNLKKWRDWKRIFFVLPVFVYNFGSSLLLTGADDIGRFFFYTFPITPLLLLFIFHKNNERNTDVSVMNEA